MPETAHPSSLSREEIHKIIRTDLLERGDNYVYQRKTNRIGWEKCLPSGSSYSDSLLHPENDMEALKNAWRHANDMLVAMDLPVKVTVNVSHQDVNATNGETVWLSTKMFDDEKLTVGQKLDVFTGLAVHEGCHILYTDFVRTGKIDRLLHNIHNIIEDERIERRCGGEMPGLANFLRMTKYYMFGCNSEKMPAPKDDITRLFNALLSYVRYPSLLSDKDIDDFGDTLLKVRDILSPYPTTNEECYAAARKIYDLLKDFIKDNPPEDGGSEGDKGDSSDGKENSGKGKESGSKKDKPADPQPGEFTGELFGEDGEPADATGGKPEPREISDEEMEKILDSLAGESDKLTTSGSHIDRSDECRLLKQDPTAAMIIEGRLEEGATPIGIIEKSTVRPDSKANYDDSLGRVRHLIPALRKALVCNAEDRIQPLRGLKYGHLDTAKLAEGFQGSDTVYSSSYTKPGRSLAVCVLVDESGSMDGHKIRMARDTAVLLNESLSGIKGMEYYVYGHTADTVRKGDVELHVYHEGRKTNKSVLGNIEAVSENADGYAILETAAQVRKHTSDRCLLLVISDGQPAAAAYRGKDGIRHTREAVSEVEKMGFIPVQIGICCDEDIVSRMFDHYVLLNDLNALPKTLGRIVKRVASGKC